MLRQYKGERKIMFNIKDNKRDKVIKIISLVTHKGLVTPESPLPAPCLESPFPLVTSCPSPRRTPPPRISLGASKLEHSLLCYLYFGLCQSTHMVSEKFKHFVTYLRRKTVFIGYCVTDKCCKHFAQDL